MQERLRRRRLPHWDVPGATYFVTSCLANSLPAHGLADIEAYRESLQSKRPAAASDEQWRMRCWKLEFARRDHWLDSAPASRLLAAPDLAQSVVDGMRFFAGQRYDLIAYVVMPSHFHWVFRPLNPEPSEISKRSPRERIMHSLKRYTARNCNQRLAASGAFWQDESYDHCVEDEDELIRIVDYVELNPVKAGLVARREDWPFSSAYQRAES